MTASDPLPPIPVADSIASADSTDFQGAERNAVGDHATDVDSLGFSPYVEAIAAFLTSPATEPPLTISIEGEWGSGKSSFMLQLEKTIAGPSRRAVFFKELPTALSIAAFVRPSRSRLIERA
ncbi:P-loop NTPase fold protein [Granulicella arctica]|uniref:P-loop NTPase fold protein n=1 Tax=Granulicella arctica TaxID=940613 RepID=UPI0021DF7DFA|nr:P-loop NTPase fold protein [Granulicella arctica]